MYKHPIAFLSVSSLTVARYAAAMLVDYIGFCFDPQSPDFITVSAAKEIVGWLSGVKFIGEFHNKPVDEVNAIGNELNLDYVLLKGDYRDEELKSAQFKIISGSKSFNSEYYLDHDRIIDEAGNIFALLFYPGKEDETGVLDFEEITGKLNALEIS